MKTYVIGDIHNCYNKLIACLLSVNFDYDNDKLIQLGDVVDRGEDGYACIEELLKIKNKVLIKGNHDDEWYKYLIDPSKMASLWKQGAKQTLESYVSRKINPNIHIPFFESQVNYYIDEERNLFVHAGFNRHEFIELQHFDDIYYWDRDLINSARSYHLSSPEMKEYKFKIQGSIEGKFKEIFIGHTPVQYFNEQHPVKYANINLLDIGAGKFPGGKVCIMNVETKEYKMF